MKITLQHWSKLPHLKVRGNIALRIFLALLIPAKGFKNILLVLFNILSTIHAHTHSKPMLDYPQKGEKFQKNHSLKIALKFCKEKNIYNQLSYTNFRTSQCLPGEASVTPPRSHSPGRSLLICHLPAGLGFKQTSREESQKKKYLQRYKWLPMPFI